MKAFWRVFDYIWPQWPRLVVILVSAVLISILFSLSFMTIVPLLKLMMGEEGLHGWADRKVCQQRYGIRFYTPERMDFVDPNKPDIAYYLIVTKVEQDGLAYASGLREQDWIVGVGSSAAGEETGKVVASRLLEVLATAGENEKIPIRYKRFNQAGTSEQGSLVLDSGQRPFYLDSVDGLLSLLPREQTPENKTRAISIIIILMAVFTVIRCTAKFYQQYLAEKVVQTAVVDLRKVVFAHVLNMPVGFFENEHPSDTVSRLVRDTAQLSSGMKAMFGKALLEPMKAAALVAGAMVIDLKLTVIFLCSGPFVAVVIGQLGRKIKRATRKSLMSWSLMLGKLKEALTAIKVVKVYNRQDYENASFDVINKKLLKQLFRIAKIDSGHRIGQRLMA